MSGARCSRPTCSTGGTCSRAFASRSTTVPGATRGSAPIPRASRHTGARAGIRPGTTVSRPMRTPPTPRRSARPTAPSSPRSRTRSAFRAAGTRRRSGGVPDQGPVASRARPRSFEHVQPDRIRSGWRSCSIDLVDGATRLIWTGPRRGPVQMRLPWRPGPGSSATPSIPARRGSRARNGVERRPSALFGSCRPRENPSTRR